MVSQNKMWRAGAMWTRRDIVPLEEEYFSEDARKMLSLGWRTCGCTRSGIGCAVCGNPLGSLFVPWPSHQESKSGLSYYYILPSAVSPPLPTNTFPAHPRLIPGPRRLRLLASSSPSLARADDIPPPLRHRRYWKWNSRLRRLRRSCMSASRAPMMQIYLEVGTDFGNNEEQDQVHAYYCV
ncbi:hypothetical protein R3P38DRAFT_617520 [Favolaschia claudopus]|uniref:Uncharacterized protein n=1 Tax=Favolaschia claudopus TaxID=2862362 RepID=A0AAW0C931_9AGAR